MLSRPGEMTLPNFKISASSRAKIGNNGPTGWMQCFCVFQLNKKIVNLSRPIDGYFIANTCRLNILGYSVPINLIP